MRKLTDQQRAERDYEIAHRAWNKEVRAATLAIEKFKVISALELKKLEAELEFVYKNRPSKPAIDESLS